MGVWVGRTVSERVEIRRNDDGSIDEVLLFVGERCVFHLEQMSKRSWYFGLYPQPGDSGAERGVEQFYINADKRVRVGYARDFGGES